MERFSINNFRRPVSLKQYKETAQRLEDSIREVNGNVTSKLLLTTNGADYCGPGSLTVVTPESKAARERREEFSLSDLNEDLWQRSFEAGLYLHDNTVEAPYMITLSVGRREPRSMIFYGQCLDEKSQEVFNSFRKAKWPKKVGDGYGKPSPFAIAHARSSLGI